MRWQTWNKWGRWYTSHWRQWLTRGAARKAQLVRSLTALWFMLKDARTPWPPKLVALTVLAYALSPVDLIPDFIPVLGLLDDLILLPLGVALAIKLVPAPLWREMLHKADQFTGRLPKKMAGLVLVLLIWALALVGLAGWLVPLMVRA